jgi:oxygen-independent coproporphyrinogen-3 oxidase
VAGIYVHIPFCRKACHYCNFHFSTSLKNIEPLIDSICLEIQKRSDFFANSTSIETLYFGGGTPSLLDTKYLIKIFNSLKEVFNFDHIKEITIETNPDDINFEKLSEYKSLGINRLSIGIQSFIDEELHQLNRIHSRSQSIEALSIAEKVGFRNVNIDLMFGLPKSSLKTLKESLDIIGDFNITHLSCYNLTVEERTSLWHFVNKENFHLPAEDEQYEQFLFIHECLKKMEYDHYEISNYSKPGFESLHNKNYWNRQNYLGIGPSAHSFSHNIRQWNVSNNPIYIKSLNNDLSFFEIETLTEWDHFNECIMLGLRQKKGLSKNIINNVRSEIKESFLNDSRILISQGMLNETISHYYLNTEQFYLSDHISSQLFSSEEKN